jgi:hypothetical protein
MLRVHIRKRAFTQLADPTRCAAGVDDQGFMHAKSPEINSIDFP